MKKPVALIFAIIQESVETSFNVYNSKKNQNRKWYKLQANYWLPISVHVKQTSYRLMKFNW